MPNNCVTCGRIRDRRMNSTNWERHTNACALNNVNTKRKKKVNELQLQSNSIQDFFNKKIKIQSNNGKSFNTINQIYRIYSRCNHKHILKQLY